MKALLNAVNVIIDFIGMIFDNITALLDMAFTILTQSRFIFDLVPAYIKMPIFVILTLGVAKLILNHGGNQL